MSGSILTADYRFCVSIARKCKVFAALFCKSEMTKLLNK